MKETLAAIVSFFQLVFEFIERAVGSFFGAFDLSRGQSVAGFAILLAIIVIAFVARKRTGGFFRTAAVLLVVVILADVAYKIHFALFLAYVFFVIHMIRRALKNIR